MIFEETAYPTKSAFPEHRLPAPQTCVPSTPRCLKQATRPFGENAYSDKKYYADIILPADASCEESRVQNHDPQKTKTGLVFAYGLALLQLECRAVVLRQLQI